MTVRNEMHVKIGSDFHEEDNCIIGYMPSRKIPNLDLAIGDNCFVRSGTILYLGTRIGSQFQTGHNVVIREQCNIGDNVNIWANSLIDYDVRIGNNVKIHALCYVSQKTVIEDNCFLAPGVMVANEKYPTGYYSEEKISGVTIREGAKIGINVTLLPGVTIGRNATVGAGSTVTRDVEEGAVYYGNPARKHKLSFNENAD